MSSDGWMPPLQNKYFPVFYILQPNKKDYALFYILRSNIRRGEKSCQGSLPRRVTTPETPPAESQTTPNTKMTHNPRGCNPYAACIMQEPSFLPCRTQTSHVYKRRKMRNSVALLSEGSGGSSFGCTSWDRFDPFLAGNTSISEDLDGDKHLEQASSSKNSLEHSRSSSEQVEEHVEVVGDDGSCLMCKSCGLEGCPRKMMICDLCEEAWHLTCCRVEGPSADQWCCDACSSKGPKGPPQTLSEKFFCTMTEKKKKKKLREKWGPILYMLRDEDGHNSGVRVSDRFQAEVPTWEGPAFEDDDYYADSPPLDAAQQDCLNGPSQSPSSETTSNNWLQCQETITPAAADADERGVMCGKWRRAPPWMPRTERLGRNPHSDCACPPGAGNR